MAETDKLGPSAPPKATAPAAFRFTGELSSSSATHTALSGSMRGGGAKALDQSLRGSQRLPNINDRLRERQKRLQVDTEVLTGHSYKLARLRQKVFLVTYPIGLFRLMLVSFSATAFLVYSAARNISSIPDQQSRQLAGAVILGALTLQLWRHMNLHTLQAVRKTRLVTLTRWSATRIWATRTELQEFKLEHLERMNVQELVGETPEDGTIFRICFHLEGGRRLYGLQTARREVALEQVRRLRRFINTVLLLRKQDKPESWLIKKIRTLQKIKIDADTDEGGEKDPGSTHDGMLKSALQQAAAGRQAALRLDDS